MGSGLRESAMREIVIEDCDAASFRAFLKFLYTDDFGCISLKQSPSPQLCEDREGSDVKSSASASADGVSLQSLLAISHKYQVQRLQQWCEHELCSRLTVKDVCSILR